MTELLAHSPLGASGAYRWMVCPGSVTLSNGIDDPESDFAVLGTAAHTLASTCLIKNHEAWRYIGTAIDGIPVDKEMADAVQLYLDTLHELHPDRNQGNSWVERRFHCPTLHPLFYGTSDDTYYGEAERLLDVTDYKHGAGIVVEAKDNPQLMYYGCGMLTDLDLWDKVDTVRLRIVQPRGWHYAGPVRSWDISTVDLTKWLYGTLIPAMELALTSNKTVSGEHCRFCPARYNACPQLMKDIDELEVLMAEANAKGGAPKLTSDQISRILTLFPRAKLVNKAAEETAFSRMQSGIVVPGFKLANARANRIWKEGAEVALEKKFGKRAFEESLKTPAQIEKLPGGAAFSTALAFKPDAGLTVVPADDTRPSVSRDTKSLFTNQKTGKKGG